MMNREPSSDIPRLPPGYTIWLDYAVDRMDVRSLEIESLFNDDTTFSRDAVRSAARQELDELRNKATTLEKLRYGSADKSTSL